MKKTILYGLNDITIVPEKLTTIASRKECNTKYENGKLPLFAAPMSNVVSVNNYKVFEDNNVNAIIPRNVDYDKRVEMCTEIMCAFSFIEFELFISEETKRFYKMKKEYNERGEYSVIDDYRKTFGDKVFKICIDLANGHMKHIYDLCKHAKSLMAEHIVIMTGNIANPETYLEIARYGCIDYVRIGIGNGNVCTTSANTAIHYPMASLIAKCREYKKNAYQYGNTYKFPEIVADGGFKNYDQIIKALALGADYVMLGELFARSEEACAKTRYKFNISKLLKLKNPFEKYHVYYGMSTKKAQKEFGKAGNKTAEGIVKLVPLQYTLSGWVDNFNSYLSSAMSYTNSKTLSEFIGEVEIMLMSNNAYASYYK